MKPLPLIALAVVVSVAAGAATQVALAPAAPQEDLGDARQLAALGERLGRLEERHAELLDELGDLRRDLSAQPRASSREQVVDVGDAVAEWMAEHGYSEASALPVEGSAAVPAQLTAEEAIAALFDPSLEGMEREEFWQRVRQAGLVDDVIAAYEERAAAFPDDPDVQVDLGRAYIEKIQEVGAGPMAGVWATKADGQFDQALAIDERHWEARFSKAVSLSFWPPVFGKQNEAIRQFEVLVDQQDTGPRHGGHAQTHLLLGNLYQQIGKHDEALAAWEHGLSLFPDDEALRAQIEGSK